MELVCFGGREELVYLAFYPCINLGNETSWFDNESLIVYKRDYNELLLDYLNGIFPLTDPTNGEIDAFFDVCSISWIGKEDWIEMIEKIRNDMGSIPDKRVTGFYQVFIEWCEAQLDWADLIVVDGNQ